LHRDVYAALFSLQNNNSSVFDKIIFDRHSLRCVYNKRLLLLILAWVIIGVMNKNHLQRYWQKNKDASPF
jgi:hypothetical protein